MSDECQKENVCVLSTTGDIFLVRMGWETDFNLLPILLGDVNNL